MGTAQAERVEAVPDAPAALRLVRAAAVLRWNRPDLTATLAELALESATDSRAWVLAAGWLLHGRAALGDGRDIACDLLDGLGRWRDGYGLLHGPGGGRLRVELAAVFRRSGEHAFARALLGREAPHDHTDLELRADVLTELARCAVDDAPDTVDTVLLGAEEAWRAAACAPGTASVMLLRAARSRRAGRAEVAAAQAVDGLRRVNGGVRGRATVSDHVAAALTAEWIAALVDGGRVDEARTDGLAAANRLVSSARTSRQLAGLRLAIARVTAVAEGPDAVLAALEPAAQEAADSDIPELESACRSMLSELHEAAGRYDAALAALRAAMAAERCDRERGARLRPRLAALVTAWAARSRSPAPVVAALDGGSVSRGQEVAGRAATEAVGGSATERRSAAATAPGAVPPLEEGGVEPFAGVGAAAGPAAVLTAGGGRRARRLAAEAVANQADGDRGSDGGDPAGTDVDPPAHRAEGGLDSGPVGGGLGVDPGPGTGPGGGVGGGPVGRGLGGGLAASSGLGAGTRPGGGPVGSGPGAGPGSGLVGIGAVGIGAAAGTGGAPIGDVGAAVGGRVVGDRASDERLAGHRGHGDAGGVGEGRDDGGPGGDAGVATDAGPRASGGADAEPLRAPGADLLSATARLASTRPGVGAGGPWPEVGGSLIGDALLRELTGSGAPSDAARPGGDAPGGLAAAGAVGVPFGPAAVVGPAGSAGDAPAAGPDPTRPERAARAERPAPPGDTDVLGAPIVDRPDDTDRAAPAARVGGRPGRAPDAAAREGASPGSAAAAPPVGSTAPGTDPSDDPGSRTTVIPAPVTPGSPGAREHPDVPSGPPGGAARGEGTSGDPDPGEGPDPGDDGRPGRHGAPGGSTRSPSAETEGLGLADLLAGALAAYRNL